MAIAFESATDHGWTTDTTVTEAFDCGSGSDRLLFVTLFSSSSSDVVTGVTYDGVSMTRVAVLLPQSNIHHTLYSLIAPATGSNNIVVTNSSSVLTRTLSSVYTGVSQSSFPDASNTGTGVSVVGIEVPVTTTVDNCYVAGGGIGASGAIAYDTNTTVRAGDTAQTLLFDHGQATSPAGSESIGIKRESGVGNFSVIVVSMAPVGGAAPTFIPRITML